MKVSISLLTLTLLLLPAITKADTSDPFVVPSNYSYVVDPFKQEKTWTVRFSKFSSPSFTSRSTIAKDREVTPFESDNWTTVNCRIEYLPKPLQELKLKEKPCVFGLKARFDRKGYNSITIFPTFTRLAALEWDTKPQVPLVKELLPGEQDLYDITPEKAGDLLLPPRYPPPHWVDELTGRARQFPNYIQLKGFTKSVSVWVWGMGSEYNLTGDIEDYQGDVWTVDFGSLNFMGWQRLSAKLPEWVPQMSSTAPRIRPAKFLRFKITASPRQAPGPLYVYFSYLQALGESPVHEDAYWGKILERRRYNIWNEEKSSSTSTAIDPNNPDRPGDGY